MIECGYMNSAIAEPRASVQYALKLVAPGITEPTAFPVTGLIAVIFAVAALKILPKPPMWAGR